jgi:hypothetical protein
MTTITTSAAPQLKRIASFEVEVAGVVHKFETQKAAMQFLHGASRVNEMTQLLTAELDEAGNALPIDGEFLAQNMAELKRVFAIGTIQRAKKIKTNEKVVSALDALLEEAGDSLTPQWILDNEDKFTAAFNAARPVMSDEQKAESTARLAKARETMLANRKAAAEEAAQATDAAA